jgi:hypothetical protein
LSNLTERNISISASLISAEVGAGMVNVKKNYVINGKISYLMIIFDYHYQIKLTLIFHMNYHDKRVYRDKCLFVVGMVI